MELKAQEQQLEQDIGDEELMQVDLDKIVDDASTQASISRQPTPSMSIDYVLAKCTAALSAERPRAHGARLGRDRAKRADLALTSFSAQLGPRLVH